MMKLLKTTTAIILMFFAALTIHAQDKPGTVNRVDDTNKQLKTVEEYVESIEAYVEKQSGPHIVIADVSDYNNSEKPEWVRFDSAEAYEDDERGAYTVAYVWRKDEKVVQANFTYSSPSGDWAQYVYYTFYPDGTAAKIDRELRTFMGDIIVNRIFFYNAKGKLLKESKTFRDLRTQEPVKEPGSFDDVDVELYKKLGDLPFAGLLGKSPTNSP